MTGYLVTGCGRSGTGYMAALLQKLGLDVGHEVVGKDGLVSWYAAYDVVGMVPPHIADWQVKRETFDCVKVLHVVRHPLACISSCQTHTDGAWRHVEYLLPGIRRLPIIERCMWYWLRWNQEAAKIADRRVRVDESCEVELAMMEFFGCRADIIWPQVARNTNTRAGQYKNLAWADLRAVDADLTSKIFLQAMQYGYRS